MIQRIKDWLRELRIEYLKRLAIASGDSLGAYRLWMEMYDEIDRRSPGQIERMEVAKGIR